MAKDIITIVNEIRRKEGMPNGIQFQNMDYKSLFSEIYTNEAD